MMWPADKSKTLCVCATLLLSILAASCDRMTTSRGAQLVKEAEAKAAEGDYLRAITLYEEALDGSVRSAEVHYQLGLLYDDKMNDPLHALHHFKRYLTLMPSGPHANDVKNFMKRDEVNLLTTLSGDSLVTRAEVARLKNENLSLRKEIEDRWAGSRSTNTAGSKATARSEKRSAAPSKEPERPARTYVVQSGDTLASISRKFYKSSVRWKDILQANPKSVDDPEKLKVGQTLAIP